MPSGVYRVHFNQNNVSSYRTFKFDLGDSVAKVTEAIRLKCAPERSIEKWGLHVSREDKTSGFWMDPEKTLGDYTLSSSSSIELKSLAVALTITDLDGGFIKKIMIDLTLNVEDSCPIIGRRFQIEDTSEFSLQVLEKIGYESSARWMEPKESFLKQLIDGSQTLVFRKKFFVSDAVATPKDPAMLHLVYLEARCAVVGDQFQLSFDQVILFAALQMQITYGDYDPLLHVANFLSLDRFLPTSARFMQFVEEDVYLEHRKLKGMSEQDAKFKYVRKCGKVPTFGAALCPAREKLRNDSLSSEIIFGVNADAILILNYDTKQIIGKHLLVEIIESSLGDKEKSILLQFKSRTKSFVFITLEEAKLVLDLIMGYKEFQRIQKKERYGQNLYPTSPRELASNRTPFSFTMKPGDARALQSQILFKSHN